MKYVYNDFGYLAEGEIELPMLIEDSLESLAVTVNVNEFPHSPKYIPICTMDRNKYKDKGPFADTFIEADIITELNSNPFEYFNMLDINKLRRNQND